MLHVTIPFTNEVVFNAGDYAKNRLNDVTINRFDEVRGAIEISVKSFHAEEITVYMINLKCPESVLISTRIDEPAWIMNFTLEGQLSIHGLNTGAGLKLSAKTHCSLIPGSRSVTDLVIKGGVSLFAVSLRDEVVKKLLTKAEVSALKERLNEDLKASNSRVITPVMMDILNAVMHCAENNCLHRIFLVAKMLELLFLDTEQLKSKHNSANASFKTNDLEKLNLAREFIEKDIQAPCSLIELAHKVGLNDFKLKKGFKEAFGTTVFGHLSDLRMEKAREMLSASAYTVSEVAHEVGYKNAHHFTAAFKKKFGYLPSGLKK